MLAKKPPLLITLGTALLLVGGGLAASWGVRLQAARAKGVPAGVRAVPQEAIAAVTLTTDLEQWETLRQFGTPETQTTFDAQLARWRDRWLTQYGLSFSEDIAPWVGDEVTLAWVSTVPAAADNADNTEPSVRLGSQSRLLLLPIADPEAAQAAAESFPFEGEDPPEMTYRGVTLRSLAMDTEGDAAPVLVGLLGTRLVLVAEDKAAAQQAIDAYKGGKTLADLPGYRRSFGEVGIPQSFAKLYLNVPVVTQLLAQSSQPAIPEELVQGFEDSRGLSATVELATQGIQVRATSWLGTDSDDAYVNTNVVAQLPNYLPRDTLMMVSGGNFQQLWRDLSDRRTWSALTAFNPDNLALALQSSTGLTLEQDLLPWMSGEFAIALVPTPSPPPSESALPLPAPGLVTLLQVSNRPQAEQAFAKLDGVLGNRYRFTLSQEPKGKVDLARWTSPFESFTLVRGWLDSSLAFLTIGHDTESAIVPVPRRSLATAPLFQLTTSGAPSQNNGHFYVNLEALTQTNNNLFVPPLPVENQGALRAIQALGVTATVLDEQRLRYDLFVALKRGNRPGPLPNPTVPGTDADTDAPDAAAPEPKTGSPAPENPANGKNASPAPENPADGENAPPAEAPPTSPQE